MNWPDLIRAIATLLWPIGIVFLFIFYRPQIVAIMKYVGKLRLKIGQNEAEIEIREQLREAKEQADLSEPQFIPAEPLAKELPENSQAADTDTGVSADIDDIKPIESKIIALAAESPQVALIQLSIELEKYVTRILSEVGLLNSSRGGIINLDRAVELLGARVSPSAASGVRLFRDIRNRIVHSDTDIPTRDIFAAIDSGLIILRALSVIPRENHFVSHTNVPIYSDADGTLERPDVLGVILRSKSPGGTHETMRILPTTRNWFRVGAQVSWEWDGRQKWQTSWYRDPETSEILAAWGSSTEFVGRPLEAI